MYTDVQRGRESNLAAELRGLRITEVLHTAVGLRLGWGEVRELTLDEAIQRCWPNYVIKGA